MFKRGEVVIVKCSSEMATVVEEPKGEGAYLLRRLNKEDGNYYTEALFGFELETLDENVTRTMTDLHRANMITRKIQGDFRPAQEPSARAVGLN